MKSVVSLRGRRLGGSLALAALLLAVPSTPRAADHIVPLYTWNAEEYFWTYGCVPTAAAMVLR